MEEECRWGEGKTHQLFTQALMGIQKPSELMAEFNSTSEREGGGRAQGDSKRREGKRWVKVIPLEQWFSKSCFWLAVKIMMKDYFRVCSSALL